jgi:hypothetical protein
MLPQILTVNPMKKRRKYRSKNRLHHHTRRHHARRASNPHRRHHRHTRRYKNPLGLPAMGGLGHQVIPALIGGAGAIGVDIGLAYLSPYLPAFLQSGWGRIGAQVAAALGIGLGAGALIDKETGKAVMAGALTITAYSALRQALAPTLGASIKGLSGLADFSDYTPSTNWSGGYAVGSNLSAYMGPTRSAPGVGAYMRQGAYMPQGRLGYMNPGSFLQKQMGAYMPQGNVWTDDM